MAYSEKPNAFLIIWWVSFQSRGTQSNQGGLFRTLEDFQNCGNAPAGHAKQRGVVIITAVLFLTRMIAAISLASSG